MRKKKKTKWVHQARWREKYPEKSIACSKSWRDRHPGWYRGRNYVRLLNNALAKGLAEAKVFKDASMRMDEWVAWGIRGNLNGVDVIYSTRVGEALSNGAKLVPVQSWREFDLSDPSQVKAFLAPGNFKLVSK